MSLLETASTTEPQNFPGKVLQEVFYVVKAMVIVISAIAAKGKRKCSDLRRQNEVSGSVFFLQSLGLGFC